MQDTSKILDLSWKVLLGAIVVWGMWILDPDVLIHLPSSPGEHVEMSKQEGQTFAQKSLILLSHPHEHLQGICVHFCDF